MGAVVSKAANGIGGILGNAFVAPIKSVFGGSCENICSGTWDITCFIEHLCVSDIVKLVMVFCLTYITLLFLYLLFKLGLVQCIIKSMCKMGWAACETYWLAMEDMTCFLWHKLKNTKRVNRRRRRRQRRFRDVEEGYSSSDDGVLDYYQSRRQRRSDRERRKGQLQRASHRSQSHLPDVRLKTSEVSVRLKGGSRGSKNSRQLQVRKVGSFKQRKRRGVRK
ncbi:hypothetical protein ACHQM5_026559 [Ranunculus cassubicifolius]